ncbi:hypothetical protein TBR22_A02030 [Luteitalea sp. TBR-22]|uniref:hypothetical protein n=1 Tax=Luteitalea sp. TBR-22 TaxID=2802971 RepID=UPI001AF11BB5|nr:hypothetical protein [Luteitalea sp. TBR-22]BCS31004.1 hypothetical protein TBR22_A02030 [Luteitalea sp. TBR-22]
MRLPALSAFLVAAMAMGSPVSAQIAATLDTEPAIPLLAVPLAAAVPAGAGDASAPTSVTPLLSDPAALLPVDAQPVATTPAPKLAFEYSEGYQKRAKIHKLASWATLPLFGAEAIIGSSLYSSPTEGKKDAHLVIGGAIGALFAVNTVTGVWNLLEARKDPTFGKRKWAHALLMMGADVGFVATAATGPGEGGDYDSQKSTHRAVVISAIAMSTTAYLIMLFGD